MGSLSLEGSLPPEIYHIFEKQLRQLFTDQKLGTLLSVHWLGRGEFGIFKHFFQLFVNQQEFFWGGQYTNTINKQTNLQTLENNTFNNNIQGFLFIFKERTKLISTCCQILPNNYRKGKTNTGCANLFIMLSDSRSMVEISVYFTEVYWCFWKWDIYDFPLDPLLCYQFEGHWFSALFIWTKRSNWIKHGLKGVILLSFRKEASKNWC